MRLKRLELVGFKSFAKRIKLDFDQGITAIVGPNGSGKSNISDAIRWVLGEQSVKSLRGSKLEDVIFAGSDGKRPLGMAEVQLTLDNREGFLDLDYNEVTITRRVYRSGESEFLINRQSCRLRDIQDLFTDTGLGREGYAIIGQGQIDAVLSANSHERRVLLEETAGIIKYRQRKEQAKKKIMQTEYDLIRVSDILGELNSQLEPLEVEANKAHKYQELAKKLNNAELDLNAIKLNKYDIKKAKLQAKLEQAQRLGQDLTEQYQSYEKQYELNQNKQTDLEMELENQQREIDELNSKINQIIQSISLSEERIKNCKTQMGQADKKITESHEVINQLRVKMSEINKQLVDKQNKHKRVCTTLRTREQEITEQRDHFYNQREKLEQQKNDFLEFIQKLADARNFQRSYQQQNDSLVEQISQITAEYQELKTKIKAGKTALIDNKQLIEKLSKQRQQYEKDMQKMHTDSKQTEIEYKKFEQQVGSASSSYQQFESRLKTLIELEDDYQGYNYAVRKLMQQNTAEFEILGTVADVITTPKGLETAIEAALGSRLQYLITPREHDAKLAIEWLKQHKAGRATFLPLRNLKGKRMARNWDFSKFEKCLGCAADLLEFDQRYTSAINTLLGRVVVVEDLDAALKLQHRLTSFSQIVTIDGEVIMPNGSLTGGSFNRKSSGLLARKNEIIQLKDKISQIKQKMLVLTKHKAECYEKLDQIKQELEQLNQSDYQVKLDIQSVETEQNKIQNELSMLEKQSINKQELLNDYQTTVNELQNQAAASSDQIIDMESAEAKKRAEIEGLEVEITDLEHKINNENEQLTHLKVEIAEHAAEIKQIKESASSHEQRLVQLESNLAQANDELQMYTEQQAQLQDDLSNNMEFVDKLKLEKKAAMDSFLVNKQKRIAIQEDNKKISSDLKQIQTKLNRIDKQIYNNKLELDHIDLELRRINEDLIENEVELETVKERIPTASSTELSEIIAQLKSDIRDLGTVNLGALQDYQTVKERVFFLNAQLEDLQTAKETLNRTISEIDQTSAARLETMYKLLREQFQIMFKELFQGGKADIRLSDTDNILESGVDIIAQPPGKKLQHLSLLSGGERALTAIALLLAIRKVKPTPFCVLDEIDATLDDNNLQRFTTKMKMFSKSTQFLVITHRQNTMEVADRLYGVTMNNSATSQLISVQLSEK